MKSLITTVLLAALFLLSTNSVQAQSASDTCLGPQNFWYEAAVDQNGNPTSSIILHWTIPAGQHPGEYFVWIASPAPSYSGFQSTTFTTDNTNSVTVPMLNLSFGTKYTLYTREFSTTQYCSGLIPYTFNPPYSYQSNPDFQVAQGLIATYCGDNIKGSQEVCDGNDFGTATCTNQGVFESGNLTCTNSCTTISTGSCNTCNSLSGISMSNGVSSTNYAAAGSQFKCFVDTARQGSCVACAVTTSDNITSTPCRFESWDQTSNKAAFNCTAPSTPGPYNLKAVYPSSNDLNSSGNANCNVCLTLNPDNGTSTPQTKFLSPPLNVILPENTPPAVTVSENGFSPVNAQVGCTDTGGSGCDWNSYKLKKFDTNPSSCPTNYSQYDLSSSLSNSGYTATVWLCGAAKDNLGNIGYSAPFEFRPGCRDECSIQGETKCTDTYTPTGTHAPIVQVCAPSTTISCLIWTNRETCPKYACTAGQCLSHSSEMPTQGTVADESGKAVPNIRVNAPEANSSGITDINGQFAIRQTTRNTSNSSIIPNVPAGWQLTSTICDSGGCGAPASVLIDNVCHASVDFKQYNNSDSCYNVPVIKFTLQKTDTTLPVVSLSTGPQGTISLGTQITITANASDASGIKSLEIYLDGGLAKRCDSNTTCTFTKTILVQGDHLYFAKATDTVGNQAASQTYTFKTLPPSGAQPSQIFVTSSTYSGDLKNAGAGTDGLNGADKLCQLAANSSTTFPDLKDRTWKALLSTSTVNAIDRMPDAWFARLDYKKIAEDKAGLFNNPIILQNPVNLTENNTVPSNTQPGDIPSVWTGTGGGGINNPLYNHACNDWANLPSGAIGTTGNSVVTTISWLNNYDDLACSTRREHLYCFEATPGADIPAYTPGNPAKGLGGGSGGSGTGAGSGSSSPLGCGSSSNLRATGLVSTPSLDPQSIFNTSGGCVRDPKAAFILIPGFDDLFSLYYTQK